MRGPREAGAARAASMLYDAEHHSTVGEPDMTSEAARVDLAMV
jgi:hypothetical protein